MPSFASMHRCYRLTHTPFACTRSFAWRGTRPARSATRPKLVVRMGPQCGEDEHLLPLPCNTSESLPIMHDTLVQSEPVYSEQSLSKGMVIVFGTEWSFVHENAAWIQLPLCAAIRRVHFPARVTGPVLTQSTIPTLTHHHTHGLRADSIRSCLMGQTPGCQLRKTCSSQ